MNYVKVGAAAGVLALACLATWQWTSARYESQIATMQAKASNELAKAHADAKRQYEAMEQAKNEAIEQYMQDVAKHKAAADAARADADRMRRNLDRVPARIADATRAAVDEFAVVASGLLSACTAEYQAMADEAGRNAANARLIFNSWPRVSAKPE
jgi:hypothetical protein